MVRHTKASLELSRPSDNSTTIPDASRYGKSLKRYLQFLQSNAYRQTPLQMAQYDKARRSSRMKAASKDPYLAANEEEVEQAIRRWDAIEKENPFEWGPDYDLLENFWTRAVGALGHDFKMPRRMVIGTLPTGNLNAETLVAPTGGMIVAVNRGTFLFLSKMADIVSPFFPYLEGKGTKSTYSLKEKDISKKLSRKKLNERFVRAVLMYAREENASWMPDVSRRTTHLPLADTLGEAASFFVVAHEASHLALRHTASSLRTRELPSGLEIRQVARSWKKELAADDLAFQLTLLEYGGDVNKTTGAFLGIEFLLSSIESIEHLTGIFGDEYNPPAALRREVIRRHARRDMAPLSDGLIQKATLLQRIMANLSARALKVQKILKRNAQPLDRNVST